MALFLLVTKSSPPSGGLRNKIFIGEESSATSLRIDWYSHLSLLCRWSKVVQLSVGPVDFPDFVGRASTRYDTTEPKKGFHLGYVKISKIFDPNK